MSEHEITIRKQMREALGKVALQSGQEMVYATLYQELVRMGVAPQLRRKYRP